MDPRLAIAAFALVALGACGSATPGANESAEGEPGRVTSATIPAPTAGASLSARTSDPALRAVECETAMRAMNETQAIWGKLDPGSPTKFETFAAIKARVSELGEKSFHDRALSEHVDDYVRATTVAVDLAVKLHTLWDTTQTAPLAGHSDESQGASNEAPALGDSMTTAHLRADKARDAVGASGAASR